ncbi:MAG TPA: hypothetical protein ENJ96_00505 [Thermodesulfatator atlanticus]|uniref:Uncharacterized protein n=1 Tax=Thermodesulfatator atlanticus TaxID=501497 RepID=A0A7V5U1W2_9BACT|nr:hypothetical protein [Thermodesulfatator atlanticus]
MGPSAHKAAQKIIKNISENKKVPADAVSKVQEIILNQKKYLKPIWDRNGKVKVQFHVDHIVEWVLSRDDSLENYILFEASANQSSGGVYGGYFRRLRKARDDLGAKEAYLKMEEIEEGRGKKTGPVWERDEIEKGEHIKIFLEKKLWRKIS